MRYFFSLIIICVSLIISFSDIQASDNPDTANCNIDLSGEWKILLGDNQDFALKGYDDSGWDSIKMPGSMIGYSLSKIRKFDGILWVRKKIFIADTENKKDLGISLGRIAHADIAYFNGQKIGGYGSFPPSGHSKWNYPRYYHIPEEIINYGGENTIAIKVWYFVYGEMLGKLSMSNFDTWKIKKDRSYFFRIILNFFMIAMGMPLLAIFFIFYLRKPGSQEYLFYCLQLVCGVFIILDVCSFWFVPGGIIVRYKVIGISWITLNVVHPIFLHRIYQLKRKNTELVLYCYMFFLTGILILLNNVEQQRYYGIFMIAVTLLIGFYNISCHISAVILKRPYSKMFALFGITVVLGAMHDGTLYLSKFLATEHFLTNFTDNTMLFPYSAASLYLGTAFLLVNRFIDILKNNEFLNKNLELKVEERTHDLIMLTEKLEKQNIDLVELAIRDSLTGLYNHGALIQRLDEIFLASRKKKFPMSVVMIDVDDFKGFNDNFGHQVGDEVLRKISSILKNSVREFDIIEKHTNGDDIENRNYDLAGRYGGDEFMLVLPYCSEDISVTVTERICTKIENIRLDDHPDVSVTGSFGIAVLNKNTKCDSAERIIALADIALYKSKKLGKNRVFCKIFN